MAAVAGRRMARPVNPQLRKIAGAFRHLRFVQIPELACHSSVVIVEAERKSNNANSNRDPGAIKIGNVCQSPKCGFGSRTSYGFAGLWRKAQRVRNALSVALPNDLIHLHAGPVAVSHGR